MSWQRGQKHGRGRIHGSNFHRRAAARPATRARGLGCPGSGGRVLAKRRARPPPAPRAPRRPGLPSPRRARRAPARRPWGRVGGRSPARRPPRRKPRPRPRPAPRAGRHLRERCCVSAAAAPARAVLFVPWTRHPFPPWGSPRSESRRRARRRAREATSPPGSRRGTGGAAPRPGASPQAGPRLPPQPPFLTAARALVPARPAGGDARARRRRFVLRAGPAAGESPARKSACSRSRAASPTCPLSFRPGDGPGCPRRRGRPAPGAGLARILLPRPCHPSPPSVSLRRGFKIAPLGSLKETGDKMEGAARD